VDLVGGEGEAEAVEWGRDPLDGVKKVVYLSYQGDGDVDDDKADRSDADGGIGEITRP
jgi:hypothetical protein